MEKLDHLIINLNLPDLVSSVPKINKTTNLAKNKPESISDNKKTQPTTSDQILHLQRTIGNQAVNRLIQNDNKQINRSINILNSSQNKIMREPDIKTHKIGDLDDQTNIEKKSLEIKNLTHQDEYEILKHDFSESWTDAKGLLVGKDNKKIVEENKLKPKESLMQRMLEFRDWHYAGVFAKTNRSLKDEHKLADLPFEPAKGAGSSSLTSDIDLNLKPKKVEGLTSAMVVSAVEKFNKIFMEGEPGSMKWGHQPGYVYDVNLYAPDYILGFSDKDAEGVSEPKIEGGGTSITDDKIRAEDDKNQRVAAQLKIRMHMTGDQWKEYRTSTVDSMPKESQGDKTKEFDAVEIRWEEYKAKLLSGGVLQFAAKAKESEEKTTTGMKWLDKVIEEHVKSKTLDSSSQLMTKSNKAYETKLDEVGNLRVQLKDTEDPVAKENLILKIRNEVSIALSYANEAYHTMGAVQHVVMGYQGGKPLVLRKTEYLNSMIENYGDTMKELGHHEKDSAKQLAKSAKYIVRFTDAYLKLGDEYNDANMPILHEWALGIEKAKASKADTEQAANENRGGIIPEGVKDTKTNLVMHSGYYSKIPSLLQTTLIETQVQFEKEKDKNSKGKKTTSKESQIA